MTTPQKVEFGWRVPDFPTDGTRGHAFMAQIEEYLAAVQDADLASAWVADHFVPWAAWQDVETDTVECWTTLTYLAARFPRLTWGSIVLCQSYRNPALLAKMASTLSCLAPGRVVLGLGAGWKDDEYRAYGYPFPPLSTRIAQLEDTVAIIRRLWTTPGPVTFEGQHYAVRDAHLQPKPDPPPPIMIGGGGERLMLRLIATHADWYNLPGQSLAIYKRKLEVLAQHCATVARDPAGIRKTWACECVAVAPVRSAAQDLATASKFYEPDSALVGTPDEVAASLRDWVGAGVTHFQLRFADFPKLDGLRLFAREVMPRFAPGT
jgi:alkanesulfonate monooxygenase SsuD/methylene tetrahydromethanopterin reductase-like flavin-dependent oxidoreductase (luciferase family)